MSPKYQGLDPFYQSKCVSVHLRRRNDATPQSRISDTVMDGIYFFGGRDGKGELINKLRFLKPTTIDNKVVAIDWNKIK